MDEEFCCEVFKETVKTGGIREFHGKWISDIVLYREDKTTFSPVYNIEGITFFIYEYCPWCGKQVQAPFSKPA